MWPPASVSLHVCVSSSEDSCGSCGTGGEGAGEATHGAERSGGGGIHVPKKAALYNFMSMAWNRAAMDGSVKMRRRYTATATMGISVCSRVHLRGRSGRKAGVLYF